MIMRCGRQGWSPRRPNLICHNPSVTAIVSRVRVLLAHQGMSLPNALAPADARLPVWVKVRRTLIEHMSAGRHCSARMARQKSANNRHHAIHSITSSAATSNVCGIIRPSAFAVLRLIARLNFVACWTGSSAGRAPFRIRPT